MLINYIRKTMPSSFTFNSEAGFGSYKVFDIERGYFSNSHAGSEH